MMGHSADKEKKEGYLIFRFILITLCCGIVGYFIGKGVARIPEHFLQMPQRILESGTRFFPFVFAGYNIILALSCLMMNYRAKKRLTEWDGVDEDVLDSIEHKLNYPLLLANIAMTLNLLAFPLAIEMMESQNIDNSTERRFMVAVMVILVLGFVWIIVVQNTALNLTKKMNPEKRGSMFQLNFQKTWENSCDEAQKLVMYQAGCRAFKTVSITCMALWIVTLTAQLMFHTGILPVLCVCIIFMTGNISYFAVVMKAESVDGR